TSSTLPGQYAFLFVIDLSQLSQCGPHFRAIPFRARCLFSIFFLLYLLLKLRAHIPTPGSEKGTYRRWGDPPYAADASATTPNFSPVTSPSSATTRCKTRTTTLSRPSRDGWHEAPEAALQVADT